MTALNRRSLFKTNTVNGNQELDYLDNSIVDMSLTTVKTIYINDAFSGRPDLVAFRFLGDFNFGWLIAWHNNLADPIGELVPGKKIEIPSIEEYYRYINRNRKSK